MLFIKFIYEKLFRISSAVKGELSPFVKEKEETEEKEENNAKTRKRNAYIKKYNKKSLIYIATLFIVMILLAYISICYIGIFKNTKGGLILRFIISFIFIIIFCAFFCLIIVTIYHFLRKKKNGYLKMAYNICKIIY